jgi:hypothetical protein
MKATATALLAALSVLVVGSAPAQAAQALPQGTRVRITPADPSPVIVGELIAVSDSILMVRRQRGAGDITIPRSLVQRLEVSRGTNRGARALRGALLGLVIGGVVGYASGNDNGYWVDRRGAAVLGAATGVAGGSLIGLLVGSFERWRDTAVPISLSVMPTGGQSLSVGGRIAF